jgi:UDP-glucose 4-epimerase
MDILLTGASSFTGYWFVKALREGGHRVTAPLRGRLVTYDGVRRERTRRLGAIATVVENCPFGSEAFLSLAGSQRWDVLAHHAAATANYRGLDFDLLAAVAENTRSLATLLPSLFARGLKAVVLTGSLFEQDEGAGNAPMAAFSPYGLSKGLTAQVFRYWCGAFGVPLGKFVVPSPFGPFEEARFCQYVIRSWLTGETPIVRTPRYVRDNIHVDLLARLYADFVDKVVANGAALQLNPSLYPESQGAFALRLARELAPRLKVETPIKFAEQTEFPEPAVRINTDVANTVGWGESDAWDAIASYYRNHCF